MTLISRAASLCLIVLSFAGPASGADMSSVAKYGRPAASGPAWTPAQIKKLHADIDAILRDPQLRGAHLGLVAIDTARGTMLYDRNGNDDFMPASNFKLLVGSVALDRLGVNFAFHTSIVADQRQGDAAGNLYLRGGGDALLRASDLDNAARALVAAGIKTVTGNIVTDATLFDSQRYGYGWSWDDLPWYYAPAISALELEDGVVHVYMSPGPTVGAPLKLRIEPASDTFTIENDTVTGAPKSKDTTDIQRPFETWNKIVYLGSYPMDQPESGDTHPAVPDPAAYAGDVLLKALRAQGITVKGTVSSGKAPADASILWQHDSEPLPQLLADFWYPSDNLMGELFLKTLGTLGGTQGTDDRGIVIENAWLQSIGVDPATLDISDGSGLSQYDRITPHDFILILQHDWNSPNRNVVIDALPLSGARGTKGAAYHGTPAEFNVFAKTGSISHVRTLSGFLRTRHHGTVTFSFLINDWMGNAAGLQKLRGTLFSKIITE